MPRLPDASLALAARQLTRPAAGLAALTAAGCALAWQAGSDLGISTHELGPEPIIYELAFVLALLGAALGAASLDGWTWCTKRWMPGEVLAHEALGIALPSAGLALVPVLFGALTGLGTPSSRGWEFLTLSVLEPVAWSLALLRLPLRPWPRCLALLALCWWIPTALAPSFQPVTSLEAGLAPGPSAQVPITVGAWVAEISALLALLLAARVGLAGDRPPQ
jgi:hypothetical protein